MEVSVFRNLKLVSDHGSKMLLRTVPNSPVDHVPPSTALISCFLRSLPLTLIEWYDSIPSSMATSASKMSSATQSAGLD